MKSVLLDQNIVIIGATGALGFRLAQLLCEQGARVFGHGRNVKQRAALTEMGVQLLDPKRPFQDLIFNRFKPDIIINAAGIAGGTLRRSEYEEANIVLVKDILKFGQRHKGSHFIQISSPSVSYQPKDQLNIVESEPFTKPISLYAWSKQEAEKVIHATQDLDWTIVRLRAIYGPNVPSMISGLRDQIKGGLVPIIRRGDVSIDLLHIDDAVEAIAEIAAHRQQCNRKTLNLAGGESITFGALVDKIAAVANVRPRKIPFPGFILRFGATIVEGLYTVINKDGFPKLTRHSAGALSYSQSLNLDEIERATGWTPKRPITGYDLQ